MRLYLPHSHNGFSDGDAEIDEEVTRAEFESRIALRAAERG
jgi:hypothetical protein